MCTLSLGAGAQKPHTREKLNSHLKRDSYKPGEVLVGRAQPHSGRLGDLHKEEDVP